MTPPDQLPGFGPRAALVPLPPAPAGRTAASEPPRPPAAALFFPHFAAPSYNARYMRPFDSLTRHASSWGWLVTVSAFALLTAGVGVGLWWGGTARGGAET